MQRIMIGEWRCNVRNDKEAARKEVSNQYTLAIINQSSAITTTDTGLRLVGIKMVDLSEVTGVVNNIVKDKQT